MGLWVSECESTARRHDSARQRMTIVGLQQSLLVEDFPSVELRNDLGVDLLARRQIPKAYRKDSSVRTRTLLWGFS